MDEEDVEELVKLNHEMEITKFELRDSEYYRKLRDQLEKNHLLKTEISRRLGSEEQIQMIIYALGSLEYSFSSQYQFALALLMREDIDMLRIGKIEVFDPCITPVDANLIQSFGCNVLSVDEFARRRVEKPTLFFLPCAPYELVANLLEVNWVPSKLENLIILGTSMHHWANLKEQPDPEFDELEKLTINDRLRYTQAIYESSVNFAIYKGDDCWPFHNLHWIFFNLHPGIDFNELLPSKFVKLISFYFSTMNLYVFYK
ncbi:SRR1-like domain-containing protein [Dioscorea alata]|uniref:SRR1-like domain-containing protein n=1 Tax=Dioscorea alata TaxID=55571 RepID=A0ACB7VZ10_DIOAL|nr:SRR1-like domain-containing protein [Dioscorea alata]